LANVCAFYFLCARGLSSVTHTQVTFGKHTLSRTLSRFFELCVCFFCRFDYLARPQIYSLVYIYIFFRFKNFPSYL